MSTSTVNPQEPLWLQIARKDIGVREIPGAQNHPRIVAYHATTTLKAVNDETAWCSSAVNCWLTEAGERGTNSAAAKSWLAWGAPCEGKLGAVVVIRRRQVGPDKATGSTSGYHVGLWLGQDATHVRLLGGNQGDSVKESSFPLSAYQIAGIRWPASPLPLAA